MKRAAKGLVRLLIEIGCVTLLTVGIRIFTDGMYLFGLPERRAVRSVSISYPALTATEKVFSDSENCDLALRLTGFLRYDLLARPETDGQPLIAITYHLADGTQTVISANRTTVWWKGKAYAIKDPDVFVNLTQGLFFLEEMQEAD